MQSKRMIVVAACVVAFACSAVAVASASASEFVFSKTGTLKGERVTSDVFQNAGGNWECGKNKSSGSATVLKSATQVVTVQYEKCTFFGIGLKASPAEYELNANGTVKILKAFTMKDLGSGELCTITFPAQGPLKTIKYKNVTGKVEITDELVAMRSRGESSFCNWAEGNGTKTGKSLLELVGGTIEVK
jgi:hypothetical protein